MKLSELKIGSAKKTDEVLLQKTTASFEDLFVKAVRRQPDKIALEDADGSLSFETLDDLTAKTAAFILSRYGNAETTVAVTGKHGKMFCAAALGVIRAGAVYVPLNPELPYARRKFIAENAKIALIITDETQTRDARRLQYETGADLLTLSAQDFDTVKDAESDLSNRDMWNAITEKDQDASWKSYFDGQPLSVDVLKEMANSVSDLADLKQGAAVLDIGSGSGIVAQKLMEKASRYVALDLSRPELDRLEAKAIKAGVNVAVYELQALDLNLLPDEKFDAVVINSTIENFSGYNDTAVVLTEAFSRLKPDGKLIVSSVWDLNKKSDFENRLKEYGLQTGRFDGLIRCQNETELYVPKLFFTEWADQNGADVSFYTSDIAKEELSAFRFNAVITVSGGKLKKAEKKRFGLKDLNQATFVPPEIEKNRAAYLIYTSGSTGDPKGVLVEQKSFLNLACGFSDRYWKKCDKIALVAPFSFDASIEQLGAVLTGKTLCVVSDEDRKNPDKLQAFFEKFRPDYVEMTPSLFSVYLDYLSDNGLFSCVSVLALGGESVSAALLKKFFSVSEHKSKIILNVYGPAEACVDSLVKTFNFENYDGYDLPPVGTAAVDGIQIDIRNKDGGLLPDGFTGEIVVSGIGLARGYLNNPDLTNEKFVMYDGKRCYRTGDSGRCIAGEITCLGREDRQIKVNGNRIEINEIESALKTVPHVREAAVTAGYYTSSDVKTTAAYLVCDKEKTTVDQIRLWLSSKIPDYAVPSYFVFLPDLPLSASGKVNYSALPAPVFKPAMSSNPAKTDVEKEIAGIWETLLGNPVNDIDADFFAVGGHSILGIKLISMIEKKFGQRLPFSVLYQMSTVRGLAKVLEKEKTEFSQIAEFFSTGKKVLLVLFHPIGGSSFCYKKMALSLADFCDIVAVEPDYDSQNFRIPDSVEEMSAAYLNRLAQKTAGYDKVAFVGWSFGGMTACECFRRADIREKALVLIDVALNAYDKIQDSCDMLAELFPVFSAEKLRLMDPADRMDFLMKTVGEKGLLPPELTKKSAENIIRLFQSNMMAQVKYKPARFDGKALILKSSGNKNRNSDGALGWNAVLSGKNTVRVVVGEHETFLTDKAEETAEMIKTYLKEVFA